MLNTIRALAALVSRRSAPPAGERLDRTLHNMSEQLSAMIAGDEFEGCPEYVIREMQRLQLDLLDASADAFVQVAGLGFFGVHGLGRVR